MLIQEHFLIFQLKSVMEGIHIVKMGEQNKNQNTFILGTKMQV